MNSIDNQLMASIGGKVPSKIPVELTVCLTISTLIFCAVGFYLNVSTFTTVIRHRQQRVRFRLRVISLLGHVFSYLIFLAPTLILLIDFYFDRIECLCKTHAIVAGLSAHALFLLLNITLALIDRYMTSSSVDHPDAETKSKVNSSSSLTCAAIIILSLMLLILFLMKFVFFVEFANLISHCETWLVRANIFSTVVLVLLFVSCTCLNWMVYKESNSFFGDETRPSSCSPSTKANAVEWIELVDMEIGSQIDRQLPNKQNTIYFVDDD